MKIHILLLLLVFFSYTTYAQDKLEHPDKSYQDEEGNLYWNKSLPVYLHVSSEPDGKKTRLVNKKQSRYTDPFYLDTEGPNYIRSKWIVDPDTKKTVMPQREVLFKIIADSKPPEIKANFNDASKHEKNSVTYFGRDLKVNFTCKDKFSGVENIYVAIDNGEFKKFDNNLTFNSDGQHTIKYYCVDNVGNETKIKTNTFLLDFTPPTTSFEIKGISIKNSILSANSKISLNAKDNASGAGKTFYRIDNGKFILYKGSISMLNIKNGSHILEYYSLDKVNNKEAIQKFEFFLDKEAPITTYEVLGDRFDIDGKTYFSGRTKFKIIAVDNKSGIEAIKYSIDNNKFTTYTAPFYLPSSPGFHEVTYFSLDKIGNQSFNTKGKYSNYKYNRERIYVDLVGPSLNHKFSGKTFRTKDTVYCGKNTKIHLNGKDTESGLSYITYSIDGKQKESKYTVPFSLSENGKHMIEYFAYDNVNNRNTATMYVVADLLPPEPATHFSTPPRKKINEINVYPTYVNIYLSAIDNITGTEKIEYSFDDINFKLYTNKISKFKQGENTLFIKAYDKLNNMKKIKTKFYIE